MKYAFTFLLSLSFAFSNAQILDQLRSNKRVPFVGVATRVDTVGGILTITYPKDWKPDPAVPDNGANFYRSLVIDGKTEAHIQINVLWLDNVNVVDEAKAVNQMYTGEDGLVATTQVDKRDAAYCFYKQTSSLAPENNLTFKTLIINGDNKVRVTFKTASRNDIPNWKYANVIEDIEDSIKFLKIEW
jgi:hypothetical protein